MQQAAPIYMKDDPMDAFVRSANQVLIASWAELERIAAPAPIIDWEEWKEALLHLAETPEQELLVRGALAAVIKTSNQTSEHVTFIRLLTLAKRLGNPDLAFPFSLHPSQGDGEDDMP